MSGFGFNDSDSLARRTIDIASRFSGLGSAGATTYNIINGLNISGGFPMLPSNTDHQGFTFFTRPQLNLTYDNVITSRRMSAYANQDPMGAANAIRCLLQPDGFVQRQTQQRSPGTGRINLEGEMDIRSSIVDDKNPFITIMSNLLLTVNGFPDLAADTFTSDEGMAKEQVSWIDDRPYQLSTWDATLNFQNFEGDFLTNFFHCWYEYACRVAEGSMNPFPFNIINNRIDYQTRMYRITMDRSKKYVQNIAATIMFPTGVPIGAVFNYNHEDKLNNESAQVSVPFRCIGVEYNDPILIKEFNDLVTRFNPLMRDAETNGSYDPKLLDADRIKYMRKISPADKLLMSYRAYPRISSTNELEWWAPIDVYDQIYNSIKQT